MSSKTAKIGPQSIAGLQPGEVVWDTELKRFGARKRYASGSTIFFVKAQIHRRQRWITIGRLGPVTPAEARTKARQMLERALQTDANLAEDKRILSELGK